MKVSQQKINQVLEEIEKILKQYLIIKNETEIVEYKDSKSIQVNLIDVNSLRNIKTVEIKIKNLLFWKKERDVFIFIYKDEFNNLILEISIDKIDEISEEYILIRQKMLESIQEQTKNEIDDLIKLFGGDWEIEKSLSLESLSKLYNELVESLENN